MVRVFKVKQPDQASKQFVRDHLSKYDANEWYRPGAYPPALDSTISKAITFKQLEDFNRK